MTFVSAEGSSSNGSENGSTYESSSSISSATSSGGTEQQQQQQQQQVPKKAAVSQAPRLFGRAVSLPLCPAPLPARGGGIAGQASSASRANAGQKPMAANAPNRATVPMHVVGHVHSPLGQANSGYAIRGNPAPIAPRRVPPAQAASSPKTPIMPAPPTDATSNTNIPILPNNSANLTKPPPVTSSFSPFTASSDLQLSLAIASTANTKQDVASLTPPASSKQNPTKGPAPRAKYKKRKTKDTDTTATITTTKGHPDQAQRERNKEHAKNTRLRKKAYIDTLKATLVEMVEQRDANLREISLEAQRNDQHRQVRWQVLQTFLGMRGRAGGCGDSSYYIQDEHAGWSALLEDAFTLTRPGGFQKSAAGTHVETERVVLEGIVPAMSDPNEATRLIRECSSGKSSACVEFTYSCDQSTMLMDGCTCVIHWSGGTHDARSKSVRFFFSFGVSFFVSTFCHYRSLTLSINTTSFTYLMYRASPLKSQWMGL